MAPAMPLKNKIMFVQKIVENKGGIIQIFPLFIAVAIIGAIGAIFYYQRTTLKPVPEISQQPQPSQAWPQPSLSPQQPLQQPPEQLQPQTRLPVSSEPQQSRPDKQAGSSNIAVKTTGAKYKTVFSKPDPSGWFTTGQNADIVLSAIDFNNTGGPLLFNHPGTVASDGTHLLLADRNNNRVLIWNKLPTGNTPPDLVLGQKNFTANNPGTELDEMNWPVSVSVGGGKVVVADTYNNRILIWNSFPTRNGQAADLTLEDQVGTEKKRITGPWGVWTNGKKLAVSNTWGAGSVLLWNNFPTDNNQPADIYLKGQGTMGTPRTITSDGEHLIVGDHNARVSDSVNPGGSNQTFGVTIGNFFWKTWPVRDDTPYDFFMSDPYDSRGAWMQGDFTKYGKLILFGTKLHIWNSFPENANARPDISVGPFTGGDGSGLAVAGNKLYLSLSNGNKIVGFNALPNSSNAKPDFVIGSPDIYTNTLDTNFIMSNPVPATDGKSLFVSSDFDRKLYVYKNLPDESGAHPDFVYSLPEPAWDNELFDNILALAGKQTVYIWKKLPKNGEKPDIMLQNSIGNVLFQELQGIAMDKKYFYLADGKANKIYVWEGIPTEKSNPVFTLEASGIGRLSSDGKYLAGAFTGAPAGGDIRIYRIENLNNSSQPISLVNTLAGKMRFNLPQGVALVNGKLIVGDTGFNRVEIWNSVESAIFGQKPDAIWGYQGTAMVSDNAKPKIGKSGLFWPATIAFDGSFLWVGEFKFSERLLRFSVQ
jgi:hypothetical protein